MEFPNFWRVWALTLALAVGNAVQPQQAAAKGAVFCEFSVPEKRGEVEVYWATSKDPQVSSFDLYKAAHRKFETEDRKLRGQYIKKYGENARMSCHYGNRGDFDSTDYDKTGGYFVIVEATRRARKSARIGNYDETYFGCGVAGSRKQALKRAISSLLADAMALSVENYKITAEGSF